MKSTSAEVGPAVDYGSNKMGKTPPNVPVVSDIENTRYGSDSLPSTRETSGLKMSAGAARSDNTSVTAFYTGSGSDSLPSTRETSRLELSGAARSGDTSVTPREYFDRGRTG